MPTSEIVELPEGLGFLVRICGEWDGRVFHTGRDAVQYLRDSLLQAAQ
jgi:hypothetical protein